MYVSTIREDGVLQGHSLLSAELLPPRHRWTKQNYQMTRTASSSSSKPRNGGAVPEAMPSNGGRIMRQRSGFPLLVVASSQFGDRPTAGLQKLRCQLATVMY